MSDTGFPSSYMIWGGRLGELPAVRYCTSFVVKSAQREVKVDRSHARQVLDTKFSQHSPTGSGVEKTNILTNKGLPVLLEPEAKADTTHKGEKS